LLLGTQVVALHLNDLVQIINASGLGSALKVKGVEMFSHLGSFTHFLRLNIVEASNLTSHLGTVSTNSLDLRLQMCECVSILLNLGTLDTGIFLGLVGVHALLTEDVSSLLKLV